MLGSGQNRLSDLVQASYTLGGGLIDSDILQASYIQGGGQNGLSELL